MNSFVDLLDKSLPIRIADIILVVFCFWHIIKLTYSLLFSRIKKIIKKRTDSYIKLITSPEFIGFQNDVLRNYYGKSCTEVLGTVYPIHTFKGMSYCFEDLNNKRMEILDLEYKEIIDYSRKYYKKYESIMSPKKLIKNERIVRYPNRRGFMLKELKFDNDKICCFHAWVGTYGDTVYTCHILEYEMVALFNKYKKCTSDNYEKIKSKLTIRNRIHSGKEISEVLSTGCNRASLLAVNVLIMCKDQSDSQYKFVMPLRSKKVATSPDHFQFTPAGEFEVLDNSNKIAQDFSVIDAIWREYLEEMFNEPLDGEKTVISEVNFKNHKEIKNIIDMINRRTAFFEFLGSVVSLSYLRHNLCFLLRIDDENFAVNYKLNYESSSGWRSQSIEEVEERIRTEKVEPYEKSMLPSIEEVERRIRTEKVEPYSIGLWHLAQSNHLFKDIFEKKTIN